MWEHLFSLIYRSFRLCIKGICYCYASVARVPHDLERVVHIGHKALAIINACHVPLSYSYSKKNHELELYDLQFDNPLTVAAYESNVEMLSLFIKLGVGGVCYKTMMGYPRTGNARPRLQELKRDGHTMLINAMGLPGLGVKGAMTVLDKSKIREFNKPIGLSIGGESFQQYIDTFDEIESIIKSLSHPHYYEINISCPNTDEGLDMSKDVQVLHRYLTLIRAKTQRVISVKVSPDQSDTLLASIAECIQQFDKMVINAGNTQFRSCEQVGLPQHSMSRGGGGLSGETLFKRTLEMIVLLKPFGVPLIATGGINSYDKVIACQDKGATLVGMATALALDPYCIPKILKKL